ncbi:MAG: PilW family protein [Gammaproteobacteria bacterium]
MRCQKKITGVTLVELLIAMAISSVLLVGVGSIYSNTKRTYFVQDEFGLLQENARYALDVLTKEIRNAGYIGCKSLSLLSPNSIVTNAGAFGGVDFTPQNFILGHTNSGGVTNPPFPSPSANIEANTDGLTIRRASSCGGHLTGNTDPNNANVQLTSNCGFKQNEIVMITDCQSADIFKITNNPNDNGGNNAITLAHSNAGNTTNKLSKIYGNSATIFKLERNTYFIKTDPVSGNPSLYVRGLMSQGGAYGVFENQIADNVESMLIDYGVDLDFVQDSDSTEVGADTYLTTPQIEALGINPLNSNATLWASVVNLRIRLLMRSNPVSNRVRKYDWNGATVTPAAGDYRIRQAYTVTINLRNRTP